MKILNLVYPEKSDIKYTISKFPDRQQNIVIKTTETYRCTDTDGLFDQHETRERKIIFKSIQIVARLNSWLDLELIVCAVASLRELGVEKVHLYTPYIMGARSDRKFEEGGNNYLKDVICPIINSLNFKTVTCIDPHSDVLEACIKGFRKESNLELVKFSISEIYGFNNPLFTSSEFKTIQKEFILVSPDAGASKKIYKLAEKIGYKEDIITCSKDRDTDGKLTKTVVPDKNNEIHKALKDFVIIDDICDGGATFINIAKVIKDYQRNHNFKSKIYLIVTHGIFSKGLLELTEYFDGIYCTNSYSDDKGWPRKNNNFYQKNVFK